MNTCISEVLECWSIQLFEHMLMFIWAFGMTTFFVGHKHFWGLFLAVQVWKRALTVGNRLRFAIPPRPTLGLQVSPTVLGVFRRLMGHLWETSGDF